MIGRAGGGAAAVQMGLARTHPKVGNSVDVSMATTSSGAFTLTLLWCMLLLFLHDSSWAYIVMCLPCRGQGLRNCLHVAHVRCDAHGHDACRLYLYWLGWVTLAD